MDTPPQPIFFLHNPKAGGSSLRTLFGGLFSQEAIAPVFCNAPNDNRANAQSIEQHRGYSFYAGHYGHDAFELLREGHRLITNFRDPVERIISLYRYWRNNIAPEHLGGLDQRDAALVMLSHELDFPSFIRCTDEDLLLYISNFHFRQLHRSSWTASPTKPADVTLVKQRISHMPWFYIAEMPHISVLLLRAAFPELGGASVPNDNSSLGHKVPLEPADIEHLVELNRFDYEIYYHAVREQHERLARIPVQFRPD